MRNMEYLALYPENQMRDILFQGVEEIIGEKDARRVKRQAKKLDSNYQGKIASQNPKENSSLKTLAFEEALREVYGGTGSKGVAQRAGQAAFKSLLKKYGDEMGLRSLDYRLLPSKKRIRSGMEAMAKVYNKLCLANVQVEEEPEHWHWVIESSLTCCKQWEVGVMCHFTVGLLQGFLGWVSAGKVFDVKEIQCVAGGFPKCVIQVSKNAME
jgi:predicted hydrocarbon binding protein